MAVPGMENAYKGPLIANRHLWVAGDSGGARWGGRGHWGETHIGLPGSRLGGHVGRAWTAP